MPRTIDYSPNEIRAGVIIRHRCESLTVQRVIYRRGHGLELHTQRPDGRSGPNIYPHPDERVAVYYMPPLSDDEQWDISRSTSDYPWAEETV